MINTALLREEVQEYLLSHEHTPLPHFIFKGSPFQDLTIQELAQQLDGKRRIKTKLPLWHDTAGILFPPKLNLEQTSSAYTAGYKAQLASGKTLIDMTGGLGVDSYYFAKQVQEVYHIEMNREVSAFAKANFIKLNAHNITPVVANSLEYISTQKQRYDTIYVDPARRDDVKGKVFMLSDCLPNIPKHLDMLLQKGKQILLKTSPMLDIRAGLSELKNVSEIHIIALRNEVKEVLWRMGPSKDSKLKIVTINKKANGLERTSCLLQEMSEAASSYSLPQEYLYEPNAALLKAGAFHWISERYKVAKLHPHSHLYTSNALIDFPGRRFKIVRVLAFDNKLKTRLKIQKANITRRNFKLSVASLRKKLALKEGGSHYLFFTTDTNDKQIVLACEKIL